MKRFHLRLACYVISLSVVAGSCSIKSMAIRNNSVKNGAIPADFGEHPGTVLFLTTGDKKYDRTLKEQVKKGYHGQYEFAPEKDLGTEKYKDTEKYRYVFMRTEPTRTITEFKTRSTGVNTKEVEIDTNCFHIIDRRKNITYSCGMTSDFYGTLIKAYMINLEKERVKGKGN